MALKVLRPELAAVVGGERFLAEIETTASLQHPHILPLFDSGEADGLLFYVMPYVEGETLRERLDREHQLPVEDAVHIATNLAEALDYAHRHGVVHRDIKPANVLLQDGKALISDFGIALALTAGGGDRITETGLSLGTPQYMSPEQATGDKSVGPATDIWALGCVLYEMLVGKPPYTGGTPQSILGKIITADVPSASDERRTVPHNVEATVAKALEKLPVDRFAGSSDFARALADPGFRHGGSVGAVGGSGPGLWKPAAIAFAGLSVALLALATWLYVGGRDPSQARAERFVIPFATGQEPSGYSSNDFTVSPDGSMLVYRGVDGRLWVRRFSDLEPSPIPGSEGALYPAISPDGTDVAFSQAGQIRVVSVDGGAERTLVEGLWPRWGPDDNLFAATSEGLVRVPSVGGEPVVVAPRRAGEGSYGSYVFVASVSDAVLFLVGRDARWDLYAQPSDTGERRLLRSDLPLDTRLLAEGRLLYREGGVLTVDHFDEGALELLGRPVSLLENVNYFFLSDRGRLVYTTTERAPGQFLWVNRSGVTEEVDPGWRVDLGGNNWGFELSEDDGRLAFQHRDDSNLDIWVKELPAGEAVRLTRHSGIDFLPRWGPDDASVTFTSTRDSHWGVWSVAADGTAEPEPLFSQTPVARGFWGPDGWLVLRTTQGSEPAQAALAGEDILAYRPGVDSVPVPLAASADAEESLPALSPDGRWLAYRSNETGRREIFVLPFPDAGSARGVQISSDGGGAPLWARSGSELFYVEPETRDLISVTYDTTSVFRVVGRERLFTLPDDIVILGAGNYYDVSRDDQRFLMVRKPEGSGTVHVVDNWVQELNARLSN